MPKIDVRFRKLFFQDFRDSIRGRTIVHHLGFSPDARIAMRYVVAYRSRRTGGMLLAAAHDNGQRMLAGANFGCITNRDLFARFPIAAIGDRLLQQLDELVFQIRKRDAILRPLWTGNAGHDGREIKFQHGRVIALAFSRNAEHALGLKIIPHRLYLFIGSARRFQIKTGLFVRRKVTHRRAVLGRHVGNRRAIGYRKRGRACAVKLDELADDFRFAQHFCYRQNQIGCGHAFAQLAAHVHADNIGSQKVNRLAQHRGFGFDTADTPADDAESIDHRGVRIGAHQTVRIIKIVLAPDAFAQVFEVHLMANADARRNHAEAIECLHAPLQKLITRVVAAELHLHVFAERGAAAREINLHRMIDHQIDGNQRLDHAGIFVETHDRRPHRRQIDQQRHSGKVLQQDARDHERHFLRALGFRSPVGNRAYVVFGAL